MVTSLLAFAYVAIAAADLAAPVPGMAAAAPMGMPAVAFVAAQCNTLEELEAWREKTIGHIYKFVPKQFQQFASKSIEGDYQKRKAELLATGGSDVAGNSPEVNLVAEQPRTEPQSAGVDLRHMLADVVKCNSIQELEAWRFAVRDFIENKLPPEFKPFALADMERHFEIRLADLRRVSPATEAQVLAQKLADVDQCTSEPELMVWRENVASHIRAHLPARFQIPALNDMQFRFDRRLDIIQKAASNPQMQTSATVESSRMAETISPAAGFSTFAVVLGGLLLPAFMAVFAAFIRARRKLFAIQICDAETQLVEA